MYVIELIFFSGTEHSLTLLFTILYLSAALIQVGLLLKMATKLVDYLWQQNIDPDNAAIPYLTSMGDLLGGGLLSLAVYIEFLLK